MAAAGILPQQAECIKVVILSDKCMSDHGIKCVSHVLPDSLDFAFPARVNYVIFLDHGSLWWGHASGFPGKPFGIDDEPMDCFVHENAAHVGPDTVLIVESPS